MDALRWFDIMCATGRVNVMIARPPAQLARIDPTLHFERAGLRRLFDVHRLRLRNRFRTAREFHGIRARRQFKSLTIRTVNLRVKREVGSKPFGLRWVNAALSTTDEKRSRGGLII